MIAFIKQKGLIQITYTCRTNLILKDRGEESVYRLCSPIVFKIMKILELNGFSLIFIRPMVRLVTIVAFYNLHLSVQIPWLESYAFLHKGSHFGNAFIRVYTIFFLTLFFLPSPFFEKFKWLYLGNKPFFQNSHTRAKGFYFLSSNRNTRLVCQFSLIYIS